MQFSKQLRDPVKQGTVTCSVRIWKQPRVRKAGRYRLDDGHIVVESISQISLADVTPELARRCGFSGLVELLKVARHGAGERVYLIHFHYEAPQHIPAQCPDAGATEGPPGQPLLAALNQHVANWRGRSTNPLTVLFDQFSNTPDFVSTLLLWGLKPSRSSGTTWLLKRHLETGATLTRAQTKTVLTKAPDLSDWPSKLHLLQMLPYLDLSIANRAQTTRWLDDCLEHENKMVRAWAYHGHYEMARQYPELQNRTIDLLAGARDTEAPSVRARVRRCLKAGF